MPSTHPSSVCVDSSESRYGTRIDQISPVPSGVPIEKIENDASAPHAELNSASAAAIFIGWVETMTRPSWSPARKVPAKATIMPHSPNFRAGRIISMFRLRAMCQAAAAITTPDENMNAAKIVCGNAARAIGLKTTSRKLFISAREPSSAIW